MLDKKRRINRGKEYGYLYKNGRRITGKYIIVFIKENNLMNNRFGIVTSKKIGNAVIRNRAKRQIREVIRKNLQLIRPGYNMVIIARFNIKEVIFDLIEKDYLRIMKKASLY
ncbi:MAG: ribonuclease P protein component [Firmicutes bacterium HGW-Firmicutes-15]|nr:MAG: ribonuclease P protein component [Firmicutes bacterium HGW-Firmicutes-15]